MTPFRNSLLLLALIIAAPAPALSDLLTRDGLGGRADYLERVQTLTAALPTTGGDAPLDARVRDEWRATARTIAAALQDMILSEGRQREGKASLPLALRAPASLDASGGFDDTAAGPKVAVGAIPLDWLLVQATRARDTASLLADSLEQPEFNGADAAFLTAELRRAVDLIDRPPN
ncbi:MAG: hypothetical protein QNJ84_01275 [Alphaproteobacteria bacterium]|nr:hypothetical protein [Alphaproteobacteria bacterium]